LIIIRHFLLLYTKSPIVVTFLVAQWYLISVFWKKLTEAKKGRVSK
jgi:hypothetical protein